MVRASEGPVQQRMFRGVGLSRSLGDAQVDRTNDPLAAGMYAKQRWSAGVWGRPYAA
ncbi:hypothetical protein QFZ24_008704 [Streptomyces phaeochromogenes]|uniref:hypothetical protein n=1 Tax=Streptomyces phaeochromogenes TaxID=1923 RepID=UPI00278F197F|nr:hypothetical protein [Streptomyces phaeochromogenes]MDQ0954781.1 hypothetical protein [Streptomyces phaeochromogenes]